MARDKIDLVVDRLEDVKDSVDRIEVSIDELNLQVAKNTHDLEYHIRRTDLNEKRLRIIEDRLSISYLLKLTLSVATGMGAIAGAMYSIIKVIELL
jgi:hypothetical protein